MLSLLLESALRSLALGIFIWIALKTLSVRNVHAQAVIWTVVLAASLLMPLAMQWPTISVSPPLQAVQIASVARFTAIPSAPQTSMPWRPIVQTAYFTVSGFLFLRFAAGLALTWRLRQRASIIHEDWTEGSDVRTSPQIGVPVTFASTILIPAGWSEWDAAKRSAVLLHERSHVHRGDFYVQTLAALHRAVFWFSPFSWWLVRHIADLAEAASDDAALKVLRDRPSYARILVEFARQQPAPAGIAMARLATVSRRVERILSETKLYSQMGAVKAMLLVAAMVPLVLLAAGCTLGAQAQTRTSSRWNFGNDSEPYVIVSGDSMTMSGSSSDARRAQLMRKRIHGDFIWFERDLKFYFITDPSTVQRAKALFGPQEELGRRQELLGAEQEKIGQEQERLGEKQSSVLSDTPDMNGKMKGIREQIEKLQKEAEKMPVDLGDLEGQIGNLQGQIGELQAQAGEKQAKLDAEQAEFGERQAVLGDKQAVLGEQQGKLADEASKKLQSLLDEALRNGLAKKVDLP